MSGSSITCVVGNLAATNSIVLNVFAIPPVAGTFTLGATVMGKEQDPNPGNDVNSLTVTVTDPTAALAGSLRAVDG